MKWVKIKQNRAETSQTHIESQIKYQVHEPDIRCKLYPQITQNNHSILNSLLQRIVFTSRKTKNTSSLPTSKLPFWPRKPHYQSIFCNSFRNPTKAFFLKLLKIIINLAIYLSMDLLWLVKELLTFYFFKKFQVYFCCVLKSIDRHRWPKSIQGKARKEVGATRVVWIMVRAMKEWQLLGQQRVLR